MTRIGFTSMDWASKVKPITYGGSGHYRCALPSRELRRRGFDVTEGVPAFRPASGGYGVAEWRHDGTDAHDDVYDFDTIVIHRLMHDLDSPFDIRVARANGQRVVIDVDDDYWNLDHRNAAHGKRTVNPANHAAMMREASLVTCSTPQLADVLVAQGDVDVSKIEVIRNAVDPADWATAVTHGYPPKLGWAGALPWRSGDLTEVARPIKALFAELPWLWFHHSGHFEFLDRHVADELRLHGEQRERVSTSPFVPSTEIAQLYEHFDVGVIPLSDVTFNESKSFVKGLEMAMAGVPFVASMSSPAYRELGFCELAKNTRQWTGKLRALLVDEDYRLDMADKGRDWVMNLHTMQHRGDLWEQALT